MPRDISLEDLFPGGAEGEYSAFIVFRVGEVIERLGLIDHHIGGGPLIGKVVVDQVFAHRQHEDLTLDHPFGGGPKYLEGPLFHRYPLYLEALAKTVLDVGGPRPADAMTEIVHDLIEKGQDAAPGPVPGFPILRDSFRGEV